MTVIQIIKSNGEVELFDENKLIHSLQKSQATQEEISHTLNVIKSKLKSNMTTSDLYSLAYKTLNTIQKHNPNAIRYSLKRSVMNLGPTGFPFERFVARIFEQMGYSCETGLMFAGHCIEHEIDVFAYNGADAICIEAKFHNEPHLKSDAKIALYIKARFDDLLGARVIHNKKEYTINKGILITNTNFTDTVHNYAECVKTFELLSWNKPKDKNLLHYIETYNMYPITVIPGMTKKEIAYLVDNNILTCLDLKNNKTILEKVGIRKSRQDAILTITDQICKS